MKDRRHRPADDEELVARALQDDREAFGQLIDRYGNQLLNMANRMVGNATEAQDLVQETFLAAFKALPNYRADARFSTWLYRIGVNKCKDWLKTHGRRQEREVKGGNHEDEEDDPIQQLADPRTPEDDASQKQTAFHLDRAIQSLSPLYREAFILKHVEGMDYEEMSEILGVSRDTLKMRVYKARVQLCRDLDWMRGPS